MTSTSRLRNLKWLIFDMDGVITGEEMYWDAAELTVKEILESDRYIGLKEGFTASREGEKRFLPVTTIRELKNRALNSNWDIAYLVTCVYLIDLLKNVYPSTLFFDSITHELHRDSLRAVGAELGEDASVEPELLGRFMDSAKGLEGFALLAHLNRFHEELTGVKTHCFRRGDALWELCKRVFQEWYLGDALYSTQYGQKPVQSGKRGLINDEKAILPVDTIQDTLAKLKHLGFNFGIATGRPYEETIEPLKKLGLLRFFNAEHISTYREIERGEKALAQSGITVELSKPHPYGFLKAIHPHSTAVELYSGNYPETDHAAIIGDAVVDMAAAKKIGCVAIGVLTGAVEPRFKDILIKSGSDIVLADITELPALLMERKHDD
jgi:phosphoglycolate phosphatase-like HAD superfamily hydrolase